MKLSLKLKLSVVLAALLLSTVFVLSQLVLSGIERNQRDRMEAELAKISRVAEQYVTQNYLTGDQRLTPEAFLAQRGQRLSLYVAMLSGLPVTLYDAHGRQTGSSAPGSALTGEAETLRYALQGKIAYLTSGDALVYFSPIQGANGERIGVIRFQYSLEDQHTFLADIRRLFRTAGLIVLIAGFALGYFYFYRIANLITRLRGAADRIRSGLYLRDAPVRRRDELGDLGRDIYYLSTAIEQQIHSIEEEKGKLELAVRKLRELERLQKEFIGNFSHEFKTPLTSVKAYAELLDMYRDDPELSVNAVQNIRKETERLQEMVENVLKLAALEKYDFEQPPEAVELHTLLPDICERLRGKAMRFGVSLETEFAPAVVWADRESLTIIFINLIDNAVKYNVPGGSVRVRTQCIDGFAVVEIRDTGVGIPAEAGEHIFEAFYTVNRDRARSAGGTGLGLPLVKKLIEKYQGAIDFQSAENEGTTFTVRLPLFLK